MHTIYPRLWKPGKVLPDSKVVLCRVCGEKVLDYMTFGDALRASLLRTLVVLRIRVHLRPFLVGGAAMHCQTSGRGEADEKCPIAFARINDMTGVINIAMDRGVFEEANHVAWSSCLERSDDAVPGSQWRDSIVLGYLALRRR
jgi:hypothetical protein